MIPLADWLRDLGSDEGPDLVIGCTGHMALSPAEAQNLLRHLQRSVLAQILDAPTPRHVTVVTGFGYGADMIFVRAACAWLVQANIPHTLHCLLALPPEQLSIDWTQHRTVDMESTVPNHQRRLCQQEIESLLNDCDVVVDLLPKEPGVAQGEAFRQQQYRRLTAAMSLFTDTFVAVLRQQDRQDSNDIADLMEWRRNPQVIPTPLLPAERRRRRRAGPKRTPALVLINPQISYTESLATQGVNAVDVIRGGDESDYYIARSNDALRNGNYLLCYDLILRAEQRGIHSRELDYAKLLSLCNAGSAGLAYRQMQQHPLPAADKTEAWWALEGRIYRDLAAYGGAGSHRMFLNAANAFVNAYRLSDGYFSAINAASMYLMASEREKARQLATKVLGLIEGMAPKDEADLYYLLTTEAEAALILGDPVRLQDCLQAANELLVDNLNVRFRTAKQLQLLCRKLDLDPAITWTLNLPYVMRVERVGRPLTTLSAEVQAALSHDTEPPVVDAGDFVFCTLEDPIDLVAAERFVAQRARLHLTLPCEGRALANLWRQRFGPEWTTRLETVLTQAHDQCIARGFLDHEADWNAAYLSRLCHGMWRLTVDRLGAQDRRLLLEWSADGVSCHEGDLVQTSPTPHIDSARPPPGRREAGIIFADFAGFSRLHDLDLPRFWNELMRAIGRLLDRHRKKVIHRQTWGDAILVITEDAATAAAIATDIQYFVDLRRTKGDALAALELRLSAHYAPIFQDYNPIDERPNFFGTALSYAARIEPVAPPGMVFITEALAARLAIECPHEYAIEYAGELELAKRFGRFRLYSLRSLA